MGWGGGVVIGRSIDMTLSYLRDEFFLSLELRRHSETTLLYGVSPLTDVNV